METTIEAIELLERYEQHIFALDNVKKKMVENDEQLAKVSGPQPMRA